MAKRSGPATLSHQKGRALRCWALALVLALCAQTSLALDLQRFPHYSLPAQGVLSNDAWVVAGEAHLAGAVQGELLLLASNATLSADFADDLSVFASAIAFSGAARDRVRLASAGPIHIQGQFDRSLLAVGRSVHLDKGTRLDGYGVLISEHVISEAEARGGLRILAKSATVGGRLQGPLRIISESITILPGTVIEGDLIYTMNAELVLGDRVDLRGELIRRPPEQTILATGTVTPKGFLVLLGVLWANAFTAGLLMIALLPVHTARTIGQLRGAPGKSLLTGLAFLLIAPLLAGFFLRSLVAASSAALLFGLGLIAAYLGSIAVALTLGGLLFSRAGQPTLARTVLALAIGLTFLTAAAFIPLFNLIVMLIVASLGAGAMLRAIFESQMLAIRQTRSPASPPPPPLNRSEP